MYPRQCRNSAAFRKAQAAPAVCPHGIPLNHLPIGDNLPTADPEQGRRASIFRGADACVHLKVVPLGGCCDNRFYCKRGATAQEIEPGECVVCQPTRSALAASAAPRAG